MFELSDIICLCFKGSRLAVCTISVGVKRQLFVSWTQTGLSQPQKMANGLKFPI